MREGGEKMKCPICGTELGFIKSENNENFVILEVTDDNKINLGSGTPVKLLGCVSCGFTTLYKPEIIKK